MSKSNSTLTAERLREVLDYDPETGVFVWRVRTSNCIKVGSVAGGQRQDGYFAIGLDGKTYLSHRVAWLWVNGFWPQYAIDHIDGDLTNNRISNLRDVDQTINMQNVKRACVNNKTSGLLGTHPSGKKWRAQIAVSGKMHYLGTFDTPEEAHAAYLGAKRLFHSGCTI